MRHLLLILSIVLTATLASCWVSNPNTSTEEKAITYAIANTSIIDVENGKTLPAQTLIITGDTIVEIGDHNTLQIPSEARVIDGEGLFLMPGLIDAHVHYFDPTIFDRLMLANGVVLVRDMGMPNIFILPVRDRLNSGKTKGPEMITTGVMLDGDPAIIPIISTEVKTPEQGRAIVQKQIAAGVDMIKAYSRLDKDVFLAIIDEAKKSGIPVVAHLPESIYIEDAAAAGLASSEHFNGFEKVVAQLLGEPARFYFAGQGADAGFLRQLDEIDPEKLNTVYAHLKASGLTVCPTVVTFKTLTKLSEIQAGKYEGSEFVSKIESMMWKTLWSKQEDLPAFVWQNWVKMVVGLNQAGVPLMIGTDLMLPGILPGFSVHEEMAIWQDAGIPPADILRSATLVPAQFMRRSDRLGSVSVGKTASIVLVRENPLEDIRNAKQIDSLFLRGQYLDRHALDKLIEDARVLAIPPATPWASKKDEFL